MTSRRVWTVKTVWIFNAIVGGAVGDSALYSNSVSDTTSSDGTAHEIRVLMDGIGRYNGLKQEIRGQFDR